MYKSSAIYQLGWASLNRWALSLDLIRLTDGNVSCDRRNPSLFCLVYNLWSWIVFSRDPWQKKKICNFLTTARSIFHNPTYYLYITTYMLLVYFTLEWLLSTAPPVWLQKVPQSWLLMKHFDWQLVLFHSRKRSQKTWRCNCLTARASQHQQGKTRFVSSQETPRRRVSLLPKSCSSTFFFF